MKFLALLFLLSVGTASAEEVSSRAVWLFREMIKCTLPNSHPLLQFNGYGCYCGLGGGGTPVDELDRCCQAHDNCYSKALKMESCKFLLDNPYTKLYHYSCSNEQVTCSSTSISTSLQMFSSPSGKSRAVYTHTSVAGRHSASSCQGTWSLGKRAPQRGTGMSILYIAHNSKFVKTNGTAEDREACLVFRGLSTFLGGLLMAVCKRSAC
ncbi:phospholipase A2 isoform X1 [Serinus canaria]|uniref:phospholipase A2 isoform X1 n=1 Tax=Serinus canaria TaxID=9135 RepID=UPI0021CCE34F|nr:phospholipase A2 isoform X1 [Serinus canaria]